MELLVLAGAGLFGLTRESRRWRAELLRPAVNLQCVAVDPARRGHVYLGARGGGVQASRDGGRSWRELTLPERDVFSLAVSAADGALYAGTEPSRLFRSRDEGATWAELDALRRIPSAPTWSFPPRPWTSHVRAIAPHPREPGLLLAGIELGGLMCSRDGGATWADHAPGAQPDVHALAWHPHFPEHAYEAGGGGAAWSHDRGQSWQPADSGRDRHYTWALALEPDDPDTWYISATFSARHAHGGQNAEAHLYRATGAAGPWQPCGPGFPRSLASMPYGLVRADDNLFAGMADGHIYVSNDRAASWRALEIDGPSLHGLKSLEAAS